MYISNKSQFYISCRQEWVAMLLVRMEIMDCLTEEEVIITKLICITRVLLWPTVTFIYGFFGHLHNKIKITPTQKTLLGV